jgi:hypothetical protein
MGREVRRIPLNFSWPREKVWEGFLNPHYKKCPDCVAGYSPDGQWLNCLVRLIMVAGEDGAKDRLHPWLSRLPLAPDVRPTAKFAELTTKLAGRPPSLFGHDVCDRANAVDAILNVAGLDHKKFVTCATCGGSGMDPAHKEAYEAWSRTPPPTGEGWQMWETVTEGSPISPVFDTPEKLARWLADTRASAMGSHGASYDQWLAMITDTGWAPSLISDAEGVRSGVEFVAERKS